MLRHNGASARSARVRRTYDRITASQHELCRENRRADARAQLRTGHDTLAAIGMEAFAERAQHELPATGETGAAHTHPAGP